VVDDPGLLAQVRGWLSAARRVVVLTGAGISTESGIPDFRGPQGVWTKNPGAERMATLDAYLSDPDVRRRSWRNRLESPAWSAEPNAAHRALVELERTGSLRALITQNIDELHQRAGSSAELVLELHGTMWSAVCWGCGDRQPMSAVLERVRAGEEDPSCSECGGILKSATISFGQNLDPGVISRAELAARTSDLLLALGTSLTVYPAAGLVPVAKEAGARLVIANAEPTPYDPLADAVLRGPLGQVVPALLGAPA
jgi:NAD-dependent protein deacetylase/lipoamidase